MKGNVLRVKRDFCRYVGEVQEMKITVLQHLASEGPGRVAEWAERHGVGLEYVRFYEGDPLPDAGAVEGVVLMGGSMNVDEVDAYPWLREEICWLKAVLERGTVPVLGICLGAQLIASAMGAAVYANDQPEVGWKSVSFDWSVLPALPAAGLPEVLPVLHWHGQTFDLPEGARRLATNAVTPNQGFVMFGEMGAPVVGLQFHLEVDAEILRRWFNAIGESGFVGSAVDRRETVLGMSEACAEGTQPLMDQLMGWMFGR